ncbi:S-layer homology domain-containing protein [Alteribacillus sp. JSM 102045]|uniref:S-layer homology domain-containing protein n=1 Tax=Alteribacillus sp. JSM 102045 TaxID=1562101 RepID=UPI0035C1423E
MKMRKISGAFLGIYFCFSAAVSAYETFIDVESDYWANEEITYLEERNIISGYSDREFRPGNEVTRSQAALMIAEALELDTANRPSPDFEDISESYHAYDTIAAVSDEGIINGSNETFRPNEELTRGQMAAILNRAFSLSSESKVYDFEDVNKDYIFYNDIKVIAEGNITTGYSEDNTYRPGETTTRAQFSVFLARALDDTFKEEPYATPPITYFDDRIDEAEETIEMAMYEEWEKEFYDNEPKSPFNELKDTFLDYYTEDITISRWKEFYEEELDSWGPELAQAMPYRSMEDTHFVERTEDKVVIGGTEPENELNEQEMYYEYTVVKKENDWLIDNLEGNTIE